MITHNSGGRSSQVKEAEYESVVHAIVASIATLEDCKCTDIPELFGATNPEALNRLFDECDPDSHLSIEVRVGPYLVECVKSGHVTSKRIDSPATPAPTDKWDDS